MELYGDFKTSVIRALSEIDKNWESYWGLIICGSHAPHSQNIDFLLQEIKEARIAGKPFLGVCFGHQLAAVEYARNILGIQDATSEEFGKGTFVVKKRPELNVGHHNGESYWNNYEVDLPQWEKPENFITTQFHPEYESSIDKPHTILVQFLNLCRELR